MSLETLLARLELSSGKLSGDPAAVTEVASALRELKVLSTSTKAAENVEAEVQKRIKEGKLLTKEMADGEVTKAVAAANTQHEAELNAEKIRNQRLEEVRAAGIDLELEYDGITASDGTPMTIGKHLAELTTDATGDKQFKMQMVSWRSIFAKLNADKAAAKAAARCAARARSGWPSRLA